MSGPRGPLRSSRTTRTNRSAVDGTRASRSGRRRSRLRRRPGMRRSTVVPLVVALLLTCAAPAVAGEPADDPVSLVVGLRSGVSVPQLEDRTGVEVTDTVEGVPAVTVNVRP